MIHSVVIHEKPPSKRPRIRSSCTSLIDTCSLFHLFSYSVSYSASICLLFLTMSWIGYKWATSWQNKQNDCAPSEDSDQPGHPPSLIRDFACAPWVVKDSGFLRADSEDSDRTGWMPRLIWVFAGRTVILLVLSWRGSNMFVALPWLHISCLTFVWPRCSHNYIIICFQQEVVQHSMYPTESMGNACLKWIQCVAINAMRDTDKCHRLLYAYRLQNGR